MQLYWASPLTYAQNAIFINEFSSPTWDTPVDYNNGTVRLGDAVLMSRQVPTDRRVWGGQRSRMDADINIPTLFRIAPIMKLTLSDHHHHHHHHHCL